MDRSAAERPLETPRLFLEPLGVAHAVALYEDLRDGRLYEYIPRQPPDSLAALEQRFRALSARRSPDGREVWLNWAARLRAPEEGYAGLFEATVHGDRSASIAYTVFTRFQRRGLAREGCRAVIANLRVDWEVSRISAEMDVRNVASVRVAEALGFRRVAFTAAADFFKGGASDEYRYELG